jgi:simple sugar transport system ATP-binding protein
MPDVLSVHHIKKSFAGVQALDDVSLAVRAGEVHCLAGENGSGKSTLIKIVAGALRPDAGSIVLNGRAHARVNPIEAIREGVQIIYQDFSLFDNLTVAENLVINQQLARRSALVDWSDVRATARRALDLIGVDIPLVARRDSLPVVDRQLIAIARALVNDARLLILDEPTSALTQQEIEKLLGIIRRLQASGVAILFVSHKFNELFAVAEDARFTVLRNGRVVASGPRDDFTYASLARAMVGRDVADAARRAKPPGEAVALRVEGLTKDGHFEGIDFEVAKGEILGITGVLGSGRTALAMSLFGLTPYDAGTVAIDGVPTHIRSPHDAIRANIAYVPEDRLREGLFLPRSIGRNVVASVIRRLADRLGVLATRRVDEAQRRWVQELKIATPSHELPVQSLSGGNQQRVVLARALATRPDILILNGPTVGVDVGSKAAIHELIRSLADDGLTVLVISDDLTEVIQTCDRVLVMKRGRITDRLVNDDLDENDLARRLAA